MPGQYRMRIGQLGEDAVADELRQRGWRVEDLNERKRNFPNSDLRIQKGRVERYLQVKVCREFAWISAGGVNPDVCAGGLIFNRVEGAPEAEFVVCVTPTERVDRGCTPGSWRFFVLPVAAAEEAFRINIDAYFNGTKKDGTPRSKKGACQDFVGPGPFTSTSVPDHHEDFAPYEGRFDLLEDGGR